jgi:hypothetical protein
LEWAPGTCSTSVTEPLLNLSVIALHATSTGDSDSPIENSVARNTIQFIRALRERAHTWNEPDRYELMVFDFALIQVGGLTFGSSGNMISDHRSAVYLLAATADWLRKFRK